MNSLRARLLAGLMGALLLAAVSAATVIYRTALAEANAVFDEQLRDTALILRDQTFERPYARTPGPELSPQDREADLVVQVFSREGVRVYLSHEHAVVPGLTALGYSDVDTTEGRWRVFGVQTPLNFVQVAQPIAVRKARAARLALRVLLAFALFVPLLAALVWITVGRSLRSLQRLAISVEQRPADVLVPLPLQGLPSEVSPLVVALNALLSRLAALLERERAFLADAAHELRTPLTALRLQVQALASAPEAERAAVTQAIGLCMERSSRIIEQLLALARQEQSAGPPSLEVALDALARTVVADLLPLADARKIDLGISQCESLSVTGNPEALFTLLKNLVDNALRYTPEHGVVDVTVFSKQSHPRLRVNDTGPGIPESERPRVFDRFYRLPGSPAGGSGLGLAIVKTIADAHGAALRLETGDGGCGLAITVAFNESDARGSD